VSDPKKSKITTAARAVFLRYGFKRTNMNDIAEAAGISRAALYLVYKNKEDVFVGVFLQWLDETLVEIASSMASIQMPEEKLERAFEIWTVRPFEMLVASPEAKDLIECSFGFAQASLNLGYKKFEATILPVLASIAERQPKKAQISPERSAHVLASSVRGFKQTATTPTELRQLIKEMLQLTLT
jgi:AcrR family transcriptional regulator